MAELLMKSAIARLGDARWLGEREMAMSSGKPCCPICRSTDFRPRKVRRRRWTHRCRNCGSILNPQRKPLQAGPVHRGPHQAWNKPPWVSCACRKYRYWHDHNPETRESYASRFPGFTLTDPPSWVLRRAGVYDSTAPYWGTKHIQGKIWEYLVDVFPHGMNHDLQDPDADWHYEAYRRKRC